MLHIILLTNEVHDQSPKKGPGVKCTPGELNISPANKYSLSSLIELEIMEIAHIHNENNEKEDKKNNVMGEIFCYSTLHPDVNTQTKSQENPLYAYKKSVDLDTRYLHEAIQEKDWPHFRIVIQQELDDRMEDK